MDTYRIGTFNTENLFLRYSPLDASRGNRSGKVFDWDRLAEALEARQDYQPERGRAYTPEELDKLKKKRQTILAEVGFSINELGFDLAEYGPVSKRSRRLTAQAISANAPHVLALQEVESLAALEDFNREFLDKAYPYAIVLDGNDPRQIDVGLLSKYPLGAMRTHKYEPEGSSPFQRTFSRDCLEVEVLFPGDVRVTFLVNHFKSKIGGGEEKRKKQAQRVAQILDERFGDDPSAHYVVLGDLNAGAQAPEVQALLGAQNLENVVERLPEGERWTHYYVKGKPGEQAEQLDYLLFSPSMSEASQGRVPLIERRGLGRDIQIYTGERFDISMAGKDGASDHCPVFIDVDL